MRTALAFILGLVIGSAGLALAQTALQPAAINGCIYNSSLPTLTNRQSTVFHCDSSGKLLTG